MRDSRTAKKQCDRIRAATAILSNLARLRHDEQQEMEERLSRLEALAARQAQPPSSTAWPKTVAAT